MTNAHLQSRDRLEALEALLPGMSAARERAALGDELRHVGEWLQQHAVFLDGFSQACADGTSLASEAAATERRAATEALEAVEGFGNDLAKADNTNDLKAIRQEAKDALSAIREFHNVLKRAYSSALSTKLQPLGATGDLIADLDPSSTLGRRLTAFGARAADVLSRQAQFAAAARDALAEAAALRAEVATLATEPEQMAFLDALVAGHAPLRLLTPGVLSWLDRLGGLDRFVVRPQAHR